MKSVDPAKANHHFRRAEVFFASIRLLLSDRDYAAAVPLLAVHGAISLTDAVLIKYSRKRSSDQDHRTVAKYLRNLCHSKNVSNDGVRRLESLLERKTDYAYGDNVLTLDEVKLAATNATRYQTWIYTTFPDVAH